MSVDEADFAIDRRSSRRAGPSRRCPATPNWSTVNRLDFACVGDLNKEASIGRFGVFFFAAKVFLMVRAGSDTSPLLITTREFSKDKQSRHRQHAARLTTGGSV